MGILSDIYSFRDTVVSSDDKLITTGEFSLWCALKMFQKEDEEYFSVNGWILEKLTGLSHYGLYKAREKLIRDGFIEYLASDAVNKPGKYKFLNQAFNKVDTGVYTRVDTVVDTKQEHKQVDTGVYTRKNTKVDTEKETLKKQENVYGKAAQSFKLLLDKK